MVHLVPDVMAGVDALLNLATEPGDGVVINTPVYPPFFKHIGFARRRVVEVPLVQLNGRWELDFAGLEAAFAAGARGYLLCNPHNPTGRVFSAEDLGRIAALADRYGVLVMADEIHASLTLPGARHTPFVSLGGAAAEHGVTLASASKAFNVAGLKGAVAVAGSATMERLLGRLPESCHYGAGLFGVLASLAAWSSGADWLDALLGQLDHARAEFGRLLGERLPGARYVPPEASYLAWVDCVDSRPGPGTGGGVPGPRPGGARPRARLRRAGRRLRPGHHRHQQRAAVRHRGPDGGGRGVSGSGRSSRLGGR